MDRCGIWPIGSLRSKTSTPRSVIAVVRQDHPLPQTAMLSHLGLGFEFSEAEFNSSIHSIPARFLVPLLGRDVTGEWSVMCVLVSFILTIQFIRYVFMLDSF